MGNILVIGEHQEGKVRKVTEELVSKAAEIGSQLSAEVLVAFVGATLPEAPDLGSFGAKKIYLVSSPKMTKYSPDGFAKVLEALIKEVSPSIVLGTAGPFGKDLFPRLSAKVGAGLATDCTNLKVHEGKLVATRPIFAGKALTDVLFQTPIQMATTRPNSFIPKAVSTGQKAELLKKEIDPGELKAVVREILQGQVGKTDLTEASVIVSGGRAMKSAENFKLLQGLADSLGATVGASRAAVDSGYASHDMQVGQTGKTVNPNLYIACGISGAIQHLAGMRTSKVIVAINKDPEAPIFKKADYGIVGDLFQLIPLLTTEFKRILSE
ncbi:MAG: electron transfer flavoprotein subunit alpha/FixB family protein [Deltaproteobacteria bacterium]|nr:electron transfer flavoprotein subunit alpha/FixB family protein [Deltaproteobacteria bacterium]